MGVERRYVPHFKALICGYSEPEVQGRGSTLSICHTLLKIGVLYEKSRFSDLFFPPLYIYVCICIDVPPSLGPKQISAGAIKFF